jgi:Zn-dependent M28 family amino/carboxypeptidase
MSIQARDCRHIQVFNYLDNNQLWQDFSKLAEPSMQGRKTGGLGAEKARAYIQTRFQNIGLANFSQYPSFKQPFDFRAKGTKYVGINLVAWLKGSESAEKYIVITAHYDHLGKNGQEIYLGADDNASGVAAMLALAQAAVREPLAYSLVFVASDAEEMGLHGATAFVQQTPIPLETIKLNLNLDMLAAGGGNHRLYISTQTEDDSVKRDITSVIERAGVCVIKGHRTSLLMSSQGQKINWRKSSDHVAFAKQQIDYIFMGGSIHPRYHTPKDGIDYIQKDFYFASVETAWLMLQALNH